MLEEIVDGPAREPTREEVVAELVLFVRETVRELGERRASGFLKKFYGWYLGRGRFPRPFKQELVVLDSTEEVERRLIAAAPGALELIERLEAEVPTGDEVTLELPISIYGGGYVGQATLVVNHHKRCLRPAGRTSDRACVESPRAREPSGASGPPSRQRAEPDEDRPRHVALDPEERPAPAEHRAGRPRDERPHQVARERDHDEDRARGQRAAARRGVRIDELRQEREEEERRLGVEDVHDDALAIRAPERRLGDLPPIRSSALESVLIPSQTR